MSNQSGVERLLQPFEIADTDVKCQKPGGSRSQGSVQKSQHTYNTTHQVVQTIVVHSQYIQDHPRRIKRNGHDQQHSYIKETCVLSYSF